MLSEKCLMEDLNDLYFRFATALRRPQPPAEGRGGAHLLRFGLETAGDGPVCEKCGLTLADELNSVAVHNAYHLGKIVALRQRIGAWPPVAVPNEVPGA